MMRKISKISELLGTERRLVRLNERLVERSTLLDQVRASLPERLAHAVVSAGLDDGHLILGVASAVWASRLRYLTDTTREGLSRRLGSPVSAVRIRVVPRS